MSDEAKTSHRTVRNILVAMIFIMLLATSALTYWYFFMRGIVYSDDARFDGELVDLASRIDGTLIKVYVDEGDRVRKGQMLFDLDKASLQAALRKAEASVNSTRASLAVARARYEKDLNGPQPEEIQMAQAAERKLDAEEKLAEANWFRVRALYKRQVISESARDKAQTEWQSAKLSHDEALNRLKLLKQGTREEELAAARANVELAKGQLAVAEAALRLARVDLDYTEVKAPFDGVVVRRWQHPGAIVKTGTPVLTLLNPSTMYVSANIDEKYLSRIAVGDKVDISVDAYPHLRVAGRVENILRATNSQFSLIPSEGVSGTYIKVAQRVPIRIAVQMPDHLPLGPGLSVEVSIHTLRRDVASAAEPSNE